MWKISRSELLLRTHYNRVTPSSRASVYMSRIHRLIVPFMCLLAAGCSVQRNPVYQPAYEADTEAIFLGSCTATLTADGEPSIVFSRNGVNIAKEKFAEDESIDVVRTPDTNREPLVKLKGFPNKVLIVRSMGGNSGYKYTFFDMNATPRKICTLSNGCSTANLVAAKAAPDVYELEIHDWYNDWGGARSVAPSVTLFWNGSRFELDPGAMKEEPPNDEDTVDLREAIGEQFAGLPVVSDVNNLESMINSAPPELAAEVIDRVYMGECKQARHFLDRAWPKKRLGKEAFWSFLKQEMRKSPYWLQIVNLNNGSKLLTSR